ncbi:cysteine--tRNA ligase [uncultured Tateyamaria sp.]|uniref:cysteine--tRNA ligase n=1 Tax=uncultured Tateyamaria sp. TaxID=455651 RepID=UPI0026352321|nr:cysteine--tRNA ligase [uncultured Tateyamaria sp.]
MTIQLYNTATRRKEVFEPLDPDNVRMYVCGPTVYDRAHLGNARPVLVFDVLFRLLRDVYGEDAVTYVRNFTDVDDKINATALARKEAGAEGTLEELIRERTEETIRWYHADMDELGALRPSIKGRVTNEAEPRATRYIDEMKEMIAELIEKGFAYVVAATIGHNSRAQYVFLDSERVPSHAFLSVDAFGNRDDGLAYGDLSGRTLEDMVAGSRGEVGEGKRNPMDSVLWKPSTIEQPGWESDWGFGRPGWHIECSAMSRKLLGRQFDIHGGGLDLLFPHHENERAQCRACDGEDASAQVWMHNEMLQVEGKKMSKSLGNFFTVRDLLDQHVPGDVIRFVMLSTHYRKPMDWTQKKRAEAEDTLHRWYHSLDRIGSQDLPVEVIEALKDDLNTPGAIAVLHKYYREGNLTALLGGMKLLGIPGPLESKWWQEVWAGDPHTDELHIWTARLLAARKEAMETKDFSAVDAMKASLTSAGVEVRMSKAGVELVPAAGFDPSKLEGLE